MENRSCFNDLGDDLAKFAGLSAEELKLKGARTVSGVLAKALSLLLILMVLGIFLALLSYALLQWLNDVLGAPWGTLVTAAAVLAVLVALFCHRNMMFANMCSHMLTDMDPDALDSKIASLETEARNKFGDIGGDCSAIRKKFVPSRMLSGILHNSRHIVNVITVVLSILGLLRKKKCTNSHRS